MLPMMVSALSLYSAFSWDCACKHQAGGDLTASDGGHQLFQIRNLPDVGALVNEAAHMNRQPARRYTSSAFSQSRLKSWL